jgi:hypothetical protein
MKSKLSEVFSGLRERFRSQALPPENTEFNELFGKQIEYIQKNKEWLAYDRTLDFLEFRHSARIIETEHILDMRGVKNGQPGFQEKFDALWEERFPNAWEPYKASKRDFEPEI